MSSLEASRPCPSSGTERFAYRGRDLWCEDVRIDDLAQAHGTPLYVYSAGCIRDRFAEVRAAFGPGSHICYAVKANSNLSILRLLASLGSGFDLVSGGELLRLQKAGIDASRAVFAGAAKQKWEVELGCSLGVRAFQVESPHELALLSAAGAAQSRRVPFDLRVNPAVSVDTHAYIATAKRDSKFGIELERAGELVARIANDPWLQLVGYHVHLGSQIREVAPYLRAFERIAEFMDAAPERSRGVVHYDLGGGFGIPYFPGEQPLDLAPIGAGLRELVARCRTALPGAELVVELGRYLVGEAGYYICRVLDRKISRGRVYLVTDGGLHHHLSASGNFGQVIRKNYPVVVGTRMDATETETASVVGPLCTPLDLLADGMVLPRAEPGDLVVVLQSGAYGFTASPRGFLSHPEPAEVLV